MYRSLYKSLVGDVPKLSESKAQQIVNAALQQIYNHYLWHFLLEQSYIILPAQISTGTLSVTRGSDKITPNAAAKALLDNFGLLPPLTDCQLRIGNGQLYFIKEYDSLAANENLTLDRVYLEATNAAIAYKIYRAYFTPPISIESGVVDFVRFKVIQNRDQTYKPLTLTTQQYLNRLDPGRHSYGEALCYAPLYSRLVDGKHLPVSELWPHPTTSRNLFCIFQRKGQALVNDEDEPPQPITEELVRQLSLHKAYEWADSHKGTFKELVAVNWTRKRNDIMDPRNFDGYPQLLGRAIKQDREMFFSSYLGSYYTDIYGVGHPGGDWARSHAVAAY